MANRMTSLAQTSAEKMAGYMPAERSGPDVAPGMCLCLTSAELEKLGLDDDVEVGDLLHFRCMLQATSVNKTADGSRIECAIIAGCVEDESTEGMRPDEEPD